MEQYDLWKNHHLMNMTENQVPQFSRLRASDFGQKYRHERDTK